MHKNVKKPEKFNPIYELVWLIVARMGEISREENTWFLSFFLLIFSNFMIYLMLVIFFLNYKFISPNTTSSFSINTFVRIMLLRIFWSLCSWG